MSRRAICNKFSLKRMMTLLLLSFVLAFSGIFSGISADMIQTVRAEEEDELIPSEDDISLSDLEAKATTITSGTQVAVNSSSYDDAAWYKLTIPLYGDGKSTQSWIKSISDDTDQMPLVQVYGYFDRDRTGKQAVNCICSSCSETKDTAEYFAIEGGDWHWDDLGIDELTVYLRVSANKQPVSCNVTIGQTKVTVSEVEAKSISFKKCKTKTYAKALTSLTLKYLNAEYLKSGSELGLRVNYVTDKEYAALKKLAAYITSGCKTDTQKALKIAKWVSNNISYDVSASAFSMTTYYNAKGNCYSYANLMQDLMRICGIRTAIGCGWEGDFSSSTKTYASLAKMQGHAWLYAYVNGKWRIYDPLFNNYADADTTEWATRYLLEMINGVTLADENAPVIGNIVGYDDGGVVESVVYEDGKYRLYNGNAPATEIGTAYTDGDGVRVKTDYANWSGITTFINNIAIYYETHGCEGDGWDYTDGFLGEEISNTKTPCGYMFQNGYITYGPGLSYVCREDSSLLSEDVETIDGVTYYFNPEPLKVCVSEYALTDGMFTIKTGTKGQVLMPLSLIEALQEDPDSVEYSFTSDDKSVATVTNSGVITAKKAGIVGITYHVWNGSKGFGGNGIFYLVVTDQFRSYTMKANTMKIASSQLKKTVSYNKKKAVYTSKVAVTSAKGKVTYKKVSGSSKLTIGGTTGKIKVAKGTKKGTYKIKISITAAGTAHYKAATLTKTVTVKVK